MVHVAYCIVTSAPELLPTVQIKIKGFTSKQIANQFLNYNIFMIFEIIHVHINLTFEVFTAVTMKNVVFWDIKSQFVLHRRHITSPLERSAS
jgi:hypothetical protein